MSAARAEDDEDEWYESEIDEEASDGSDCTSWDLLVSSLLFNTTNPDPAVQTFMLHATNYGLTWDGSDDSGETLLSTAVLRHDAGRVVTLLLDRDDVDVNLRNEFGATALHRVSFLGYPQMASLLLKHKHIDVNIIDDGGYTPLHYACRVPYGAEVQKWGYAVMRVLMRRKDIEFNSEDFVHRRTPLHWVVLCEGVLVLKALIVGWQMMWGGLSGFARRQRKPESTKWARGTTRMFGGHRGRFGVWIKRSEPWSKHGRV